MNKLALTVKEMAQLLSISLPKAYELINQDGFPVLHVGTHKRIPYDAFIRWIEESACGQANGNTAHSMQERNGL